MLIIFVCMFQGKAVVTNGSSKMKGKKILKKRLWGEYWYALGQRIPKLSQQLLKISK